MFGVIFNYFKEKSTPSKFKVLYKCLQKQRDGNIKPKCCPLI